MPNMGNMEEMMNNPMIKEMMNNPEMMKMAMNMMSGNQGQGGANSEQMNDLMKNPSMKNLLNNPEMLTQSVNMLKNNPMMLEMLQKQMPGVDPQTLVRGLDWLASIAGYYAKVRNVYSNKYV
jgi:hypothetical protein